jgi:hypothetical protein
MRVWFDDVRPAPRGWRRTRTPQEAIDLIAAGSVSAISLDFDLGLQDERGLDINGEHVLRWIEEQMFTGTELAMPEVRVHSSNVVGRQRLRLTLEALVRRHPEQWEWTTTNDGAVLRPRP